MLQILLSFFTNLCVNISTFLSSSSIKVSTVNDKTHSSLSGYKTWLFGFRFEKNVYL